MIRSYRLPLMFARPTLPLAGWLGAVFFLFGSSGRLSVFLDVFFKGGGGKALGLIAERPLPDTIILLIFIGFVILFMSAQVYLFRALCMKIVVLSVILTLPVILLLSVINWAVGHPFPALILNSSIISFFGVCFFCLVLLTILSIWLARLGEFGVDGIYNLIFVASCLIFNAAFILIIPQAVYFVVHQLY